MVDREGRVFNMSVREYVQATDIIVEKGCFAFMFTNIGNTYATVNGMRIFPSATPLTALGDSRTISGHTLDKYYGNMVLSFAIAGSPFPVGNDPRVEIVQLYYVDENAPKVRYS